jgi:hypothetical protein
MDFITLRTITNDLLKIVRASHVTNSETISLRQIEDWVHQYRAVLLKRDLDKGKKPNPDYIQTINYLRLIEVEAGGVNIVKDRDKSKTYTQRTTLEIPKTIDLNFTSGFTYVGTPLGEEIDLLPEGRAIYQQHKKYTKDARISFLRDGHIYVVNDFPLEYITVRGIFEIPSEVSRFTNPITQQPYFNMDSKYPIPATLVPTLKQMILSEELKIEASSVPDLKNDDLNIPTK